MSEEKGMKKPEKKRVPHFANLEDAESTEKTQKQMPEKSEANPENYPLFKKLDEIKTAIEEKENGIAHQLCRIADILEKKDVGVKYEVPTTKAPPTQTSTQEPEEAKPVSNRLEEVKAAFPEELASLLTFEDKGDYIKIAPRQFLGSENFARIASAIRELGGEYVSAGRDSHFKVPK